MTDKLQALSDRADQGKWHMYGEADVGLTPAPFTGEPLKGDMHPVDLYSSENAPFICDAVNFTRAMLAGPMTTSHASYQGLENVLRSKGASDAWLAHAMPDLHVAAMQFAFSQYGAGHRDACAGKELPNPGPDDKPLNIVTETDGSRWLEIDASDAGRGKTLMVPAPLPVGVADTPEARAKLQAAFKSDIPPIGGPPGIRHISDHVFPDDD